MKLKKILRLFALVFFIVLACIIPFPMAFKRKDNLPKHTIEQIDKKKDEKDEDTFKVTKL